VPSAFAVIVTEEALSWHSLLGWHSVPRGEIDFVLVELHSRLGTRQVHTGVSKRIVHYSWFDPTDPVRDKPRRSRIARTAAPSYNVSAASGLPPEVGETSSGRAEPTETTMHMRSVAGIRPGRMSTVDLQVALEAV